MHELLQSQLCSSLFYKLILLIEAMQFLWYSIHSGLSFLWTGQTGDIFRDAFKYVQVPN